MFVFLSFFVFYSSCGSLYALAAWNVQLQSLDSTTGIMTPIGQKYSDIEAQGLSTIDDVGNVYYTIGLIIDNVTKANTLYLDGLDLETGNLVCHIELPFELEELEQTNYLGDSLTLDYNKNDDNVVVVGMKEDGKNHVILVDPKTKQLEEIGSFGLENLSWSMSSALDFDTKTLFLMYGEKENSEEYLIVTFDLTTRNIKIVNDTETMMSMDYDSVTKKIWGIGLVKSTQSRTLLSLDPKTYDFDVVETYDQYYMMLAGISTMDMKYGVYYTYLQKKGEVGLYRLMALDINSGKIISSPQCTFDVDCPLSIEYPNTCNI